VADLVFVLLTIGLFVLLALSAGVNVLELNLALDREFG